jgi:hypothetical protein
LIINEKLVFFFLIKNLERERERERDFTADLRDTGERERERERVVKKQINKFTSEHRLAKLSTIAVSSIVFTSTDQPSCSGKEHGWGRRACVDGKQNGDVLEGVFNLIF